MTPHDRRALLASRPSPDGKLDYVAVVEGRILRAGRPSEIRIAIRYVPDRSVLIADSLGAYLQTLAADTWESLEEVGALVLNDINDCLVPRWIEVHVSTRQGFDAAIESHAVLLADRQPKWDNPGLLARLKKY